MKLVSLSCTFVNRILGFFLPLINISAFLVGRQYAYQITLLNNFKSEIKFSTPVFSYEQGARDY